MSKGVGTTISTVIIVIVLMFFLVAFAYQTSNTTQKKLQLNTNTAEFLKVKNTISLLNRSLSYTWFVSTVQIIFNTGDKSAGCGYDQEGRDFIDRGYWYEYKDLSNEKNNYIDNMQPGDKYNKKISAGGFVNLLEPRICYPQDDHILKYMQDRTSIYKEIATQVVINGIKIKLEPGDFGFDMGSDRITSAMSQKIQTDGSNPFVDVTTTNRNTIYTYFSRMLDTARSSVIKAVEISQQSAAGQGDYFYKGSDTETAYKTRVKQLLADAFLSVVPSDAADKIKLVPAIKFEVKGATGNGKEAGLGLPYESQGLMLHYNGDFEVKDSSAGDFTCTKPKEEYANTISGSINGQAHTLFGTDYSYDEIFYLVEGIINRESSWKPDAASGSAIGLMQIIPTAHPGCTNLQNPEGNIECGIGYLNELFNFFGDKASGENLKKLALAAYNAGQGTITEIINCAGTNNWDEIVNSHFQCLINKGTEHANDYVIHVLGCADYYSGQTTGATQLAWPTKDSRNIASCFGRRIDPITSMPALHQGIDIAADASKEVIAAEGGTIAEVKRDCEEGPDKDPECGGGWGNYVKISHGTYSTLYAHMTKAIPGVIQKDSTVNKGDPLGFIGSSGRTTGPNLHFEVWQGDRHLDPCNFIDCSQSTGKTCSGTLDSSLVENLYYYENEDENTFEPRPFSLKFKIDDTLNILDCTKMTSDDNPFYYFVWKSARDAICCGGTIWGCNQDQGSPIPDSHKVMPDNKIEDGACQNIIANLPLPNDNNQKYGIFCENGQFSDPKCYENCCVVLGNKCTVGGQTPCCGSAICANAKCCAADHCGDRTCDSSCGETCSTCPQDCGPTSTISTCNSMMTSTSCTTYTYNGPCKSPATCQGNVCV